VDVAEAITHTAEAGEELPGAHIGASDVIAVATHGRGGLDRWALGSATEQVLHRTAFPALIVRPRAEPRAEPTLMRQARLSSFHGWLHDSIN
jgi:nucleotide-binding universal stress UspA family protein